MSGNRSAKKKTTHDAGTSRSAMKQPLNDGMFRRSWKAPTTDEEWALYGRTVADHPITEEEHDDWLYAWESYINTNSFNEPITYSNRYLTPNPNPPASQVMPEKLKASCKEANDEIEGLTEIWRKNRETQLEKEALVEEKKRELAVLQQEIMEEQYAINEIKESYNILEEQINEKADWIIKCQNIYPH